jgi:hypothetical protein
MRSLSVAIALFGYSIQGAVISGTVEGSGATIRLTGAATKSVYVSEGPYSFTGLPAGTYLVTPSLYGYRFSPAYKTIKVTLSQAVIVNFSAYPNLFNLSGEISGVADVAVTVASGGISPITTRTGTGGVYILRNLRNGRGYTIRPVKAGYSFTPPVITISFYESITGATVSGIDFDGKKDAVVSQDHSVLLRWVASVSPNLSGYRVYRSLISGGPYGRLASVIATSYLDVQVSAGETYYYVTTAYNADGESQHSNQARAIIPVP